MKTIYHEVMDDLQKSYNAKVEERDHDKTFSWKENERIQFHVLMHVHAELKSRGFYHWRQYGGIEPEGI